MAQLYGACACERNQYTVIIPSELTTLAQVFFDNSQESRRAQASPVTAWLRIPLDWYHSTTYALFPDETHTTIKRTYNTPAQLATIAPVRRQFCGYCGTHLTAWNEGDKDSAEQLDVTLGSLMNESLDKLEALHIIPDTAEEQDDELVKGGTVDDDVHIPTTEGKTDGAVTTTTSAAAQRMQNRGLPYFEEMVENSRLGRIKRQTGGHVSQDGRTTVQWEVVEIDNSDPSPSETGGEGRKRQKTQA